jgi:hypothetical protein
MPVDLIASANLEPLPGQEKPGDGDSESPANQNANKAAPHSDMNPTPPPAVMTTKDFPEAGNDTGAPASPKALLDVKNTRVGALLGFSGSDNNITAIGKVVAKFGSGPKSERRRTISDFLMDLPPTRTPDALSFDDLELTKAANEMLRERLLLIVCSDQHLARHAADALVTRTSIANRRLLRLNDLPDEIQPDVKALFARRGTKKVETLLLVNAYDGERAQKFVDSLFADLIYGKDVIHQELARAHTTIACLTSTTQLVARAEGMPFAQWTVSSVQMLLRKRFPSSHIDLEAKIATQRKAGKWPRTHGEFQKLVEELLHSGELEAVIQNGGPLADATRNVAAEVPIADASETLAVAVLYTAAYYPNLSQNEFARIVALLVGDQRTLVTEAVQHRTKDGSFKMVQLQRERRVIDIWNERPDVIMRECRLITGRETGRPVTFADIGRRDFLRRHFEEQYGAYVQRQFLLAWDNGLVLDMSERIAINVIQMAVDATVADPEQFDGEWFCNAIIKFCEGAGESAVAFRRVSELLRRMLSQPSLNDVVAGVLDRLLHNGKADYVFVIVKQLWFVPQLNALYWLQQLLNRGGEVTRGAVYKYLYAELVRADIGIHRYIAVLDEKWLPADDRDPDTYSQSNRAALMTLFAYCFGVTEDFDAELFGAWPSRFPILAVDQAVASKQFSSVLRCLLHPGLIDVLDEGWTPEALTRDVGTLISKWVFILYGVSEPPAGADDIAGFTRDEALTVLVQQILEITNNAQGHKAREWMIDEWEWAKNLYLRAPAGLGHEGHQRRHEFAAKRRLVDRLISEFRRQQSARHEPSPPRRSERTEKVEGIFLVELRREEQP